MAFGMIGLLPEQYYRMSLLDFNLLCEGFSAHKKELEKTKVIHTRQIVYWTVKGWADPKRFVKTIDEFWPLDDKKKATPKITSARKKRIEKTLNFIKNLPDG